MQKFLTLEWNNRLSMGMGLLFFSFITVVVITGKPVTSQIFTPLVLIGCVF
ncbi:MAG: hypothetical protein RLP44_12670 [Aggregatilineales bacterium]